MNQEIAIFWFRRDLRLHDNHGLFQALQSGLPVLPIFIFDENILQKLENKSDARVQFIHEQLSHLHSLLKDYSSGILCLTGTPISVWKTLITTYNVKTVFTNSDYEPYAIQRDKEIQQLLQSSDIEFLSFKDQVIFEKNEVLKKDGTPYTVFTPYAKTWKKQLQLSDYTSYPSQRLLTHILPFANEELPSLASLGFETSSIQIPKFQLSDQFLTHYEETRNIPALHGTSQLGPYLRFGILSIREVVSKVIQKSETFLHELIWREFFMQILYHFPYVEHTNFRKKYDHLQWVNNQKDFEIWCQGKTGFPLIDAGMRQLHTTGWMHNRIRMATASFLCKNLQIDWRWGEHYFASKLIDFDLAQNNGNWQWVAGTGTDAAPYFRIFNPETQQKRFDPNHLYIKKYVPEFGTPKYPKPMVNIADSRKACIKMYKTALE